MNWRDDVIERQREELIELYKLLGRIQATTTDEEVLKLIKEFDEK